MSRISAAKPKIADYPFTTLVPNLGVVRVDRDHNFVVADIPGVIENAHKGAGLGIQFLKHLERTRLLVHLLDVSGVSGRDPLEDYETINRELAEFSAELAALPQVVALARIDVLADQESLEPLIAHFKEKEDVPVFKISSVTGEGIEPLIYYMWSRLQEMPAKGAASPLESGPVRITVDSRAAASNDIKNYTIERDAEGVLVVAGKGLERMIAMTDMENEDGVRRLQRRLERLGVFDKLKKAGAEQGDTVRIRDVEFDYIDEDREDEDEDDFIEV